MGHRLIFKKAQNSKVPLVLEPNGEAEVRGELDPVAFEGTFSLEELEKILRSTQNRAQAEAIGTGLFNRLFVVGGPLRNRWDDFTTNQKKEPLELVFESAEYRGFPWELLCDPQGIAIARITTVVRRATGKAQISGQLEWPLRMLVINATRDPNLKAEEELEGIRWALKNFCRSIDIRYERNIPEQDNPSRPSLYTLLDRYQPHLLHIVGHGGMLNDRAHVKMETENGSWYWSVKNIQEDLINSGCVPMLVFLNCCRTAVEHGAGQSIQETFSRTGVPAVIAMQSDVRGDLAAKFAEAFYAQVLTDERSGGQLSVGAAASRARLALGKAADIDWALPTVTLGEDLDLAFTLAKARQLPNAPEFVLCQEFEQARFFANCCEERRELVHWCYPVRRAGQTDAGKKILILKSKEKCGKTHLLRWCMESWAAEGCRVRYLEARSGKNPLTWLVQLRANDFSQPSDRDRLLRSGLDPAPFEPFYRELGKLLSIPEGSGQAAACDAKVLSDEKDEQRDRALGDDADPEKLYGLFAEGVEKVDKVILVFNRITAGGIPVNLLADLRNHFLARIAKSSSNARIVLSVLENDYEAFGLTALNDVAAIVDLPLEYNRDELVNLVLEALRFPESPVREMIQEFAGAYFKFDQGPVKGLARLTLFREMAIKGQIKLPERMR